MNSFSKEYAAVADESEKWATQLAAPQLPELPTTPQALQAVLFPESSPLLIPVTPECYGAIASQHPSTANECLMVADGSDLPATLGSLLCDPFSVHASSGATVSVVIGGTVRTILLRMSKFSRIHPKDLKVLFNKTEKLKSTTSKAVLVRACPHTLVTVAGCTMLIGKDRQLSLLDAIKDLRAKRQPITAMHYGPVNFLLAYAAGDAVFQWHWMSADGTQVCLRGYATS